MNYMAMAESPTNISKPANSVGLDFDFLGSGLHNGTGSIVTPAPWEDCDYSIPMTDRPWECRGYGAARCYVFPAVKTYNASVEKGQLFETVVDVDTTWGSIHDHFYNSLDTKRITVDELSKLQDLDYTFAPDQRWIAYNSTSENVNLVHPLNESFPDSLMKRGYQYSYWYPSVTVVQDELVRYFRGVFSGVLATVAIQVDPRQLQGPRPLTTIFNFGDVSFERVSDTIFNLTQALDSHVRTSGLGEGSATALGQVLEENTCIRIRWAWTAYPAALVALALLYFVLMAVETRPHGAAQYAWKSSPLALLYHSMSPQWLANGMNWQLEDTKELVVDAKRTFVRIGGVQCR